MSDMSEVVTAEFARRWFRALMGNCTELLEDAAYLLAGDSAARALSLHVLAMEELAKAVWISEASEKAWTEGHPDVSLPEDLEARAVRHFPKLVGALLFSSKMKGFWLPGLRNSDSSDDPEAVIDLMGGRYRTQAATFARVLNRAKQGGFYVDRNNDAISVPRDFTTVKEVSELVEHTAQVALMPLAKDLSQANQDNWLDDRDVLMAAITDHVRMMMNGEDSPYDIEWRLMVLAFPEVGEDLAKLAQT
jgi:AbiV family abortive infection protein